MQNGTVIKENSLAVSVKTKHVATMQPSKRTPGTDSRELSSYLHTKPMYKSSESLCSERPKLETTQIPFNGRTVTENVPARAADSLPYTEKE